MEINNLGEGQLIVALRDMAKEWSEKRGLCHDYSEGVKYGEGRLISDLFYTPLYIVAVMVRC